MATLQKIGDNAQCPISIEKMRIGRASDNEIIIEDDAVSGYHAVISYIEADSDNDTKQYFIEDLDSTNNTYVNNKEISHQQLSDGDIIKIGHTRLKFSKQEYVPPQIDFQKTQKLSGNTIFNFLFSK